MLKTYRIIPLVFILFLFGFTLFTVAPVFAQTACPLEGEPGHYGGKKGMCAQNPDARSYQECMGRCIASTPPSVAPTAPSGGEVAQLNAKISELGAGLTGLQGVVRTLQEQSKNSMQPVAPTAPSGGEVAQLNAKISELGAGLTGLQGVVRTLQEQSKNSMQPVAPTAPSGGEVAQLNAKISELGAGLTGLQGVVRTLQEQSKNSMQPVAPTANTGGEVAELNAKISGLEARLGEVAQLNTKISGLEAGLGEVAQLNAKISELEAGLTSLQAASSTSPAGGEVAELNAKLLRNLRVGFTGLQGDVRTLQEQSKNSKQPVAPTAPSGGEVAGLNTKIAELEARLGSPCLTDESSCGIVRRGLTASETRQWCDSRGNAARNMRNTGFHGCVNMQTIRWTAKDFERYLTCPHGEGKTIKHGRWKGKPVRQCDCSKREC